MKSNKIITAVGVLIGIVLLATIIYPVIRDSRDQKILDNVVKPTKLSELPLSKAGIEEIKVDLIRQAYWTCGLKPMTISDIKVWPTTSVGIETMRTYQPLGVDGDPLGTLFSIRQPAKDTLGARSYNETWTCNPN